ncbi:MAG: hypothetical protein JKY52_00080 [Flavobacteriales bacterium]|nr:hypothetical protein [Flavobacteriales bacterium]
MAMLESYEYRHSATSGMATAMICGRYQAIIQKAAERSPEASKVIEHMLELVLKAEGVIE